MTTEEAFMQFEMAFWTRDHETMNRYAELLSKDKNLDEFLGGMVMYTGLWEELHRKIRCCKIKDHLTD